MFTEIELNNVEDIYDYCLDKLCNDGMLILKNNSKILHYLTDADSSKELEILVQSIGMAIRHGRFELLQNMILGLKEHVHKLAALEIKYFDEYNTLLRSDIYNKFMPQNFKKHAFIAPDLKEIFDIFNMTALISPTNAAFAIKTSFDTGEHNFIESVLYKACLTKEFIMQIHKRYHANFGMCIEDEVENMKIKSVKNDYLVNFFKRAM